MNNPAFVRRLYHSLCFGLSLVFLLTQRPSAQTPVLPCRVLATYPHDTDAFCQGLLFHAGQILESTGLYGKSTIREVDLESGKVLRQTRLPKNFFGEGVTLLNDTLYQLTWRSGKGFVRALDDFRVLKTFSIPSQGWGITHDGRLLILSDGSSRLRFMDPRTFDIVREITVRDAGTRVRLLNELEYVNGTIHANVWGSFNIAVISPQNGEVLKWIDCNSLKARLGELKSREHVLNGIAYDAASGRLFVTGKKWPSLFEIEIEE